MGKYFHGGTHLTINVVVVSEVAQVDSKGRITLPKEVRRLVEMGVGDNVMVRVVGNRIILEKVENPFEVLDRLLKDVRFDVEKRHAYENLAIEEAKKRVRENPGGD